MGSSDPAADPLSSFLRHPGAFSLSRRVAMARDATATAVPGLRPWLVDLLPLLVVLLIAAHVLALARHGRVQAARAEQEALRRGRPRLDACNQCLLFQSCILCLLISKASNVR
ncbi:hypothetical protein SORBI_3001G218200 [Sorghum bicolor]|uniref:Uncharacterized protein n=1 Tax=Sorghum bicolor TaxID=4558 RepID=A0A1Z5S6T2_SORBI|nr:hypothetical protein SORBI_3001G218200 [Sorghum bicolor]